MQLYQFIKKIYIGADIFLSEIVHLPVFLINASADVELCRTFDSSERGQIFHTFILVSVSCYMECSPFTVFFHQETVRLETGPQCSVLKFLKLFNSFPAFFFFQPPPA